MRKRDIKFRKIYNCVISFLFIFAKVFTDTILKLDKAEFKYSEILKRKVSMATWNHLATNAKLNSLKSYLDGVSNMVMTMIYDMHEFI